MRHVVHYVWPIFRAVPPDWRKRVTFDAAGNKKATTFLQRRDVSTLTGIRPRQFSRDRRRCKTCDPATAKIDKANDCGGEDRELSHFRGQFQKLSVLENPARALYWSPARER